MNHQLHVHLILDNSPALTSQDLLDVLAGTNNLLTVFSDAIKTKQLRFVMHGFEGFSPTILFDSNTSQEFFKGFQMQRFPLLGRAIQTAAEKLHENLLKTSKYHTPWMFVLTSGLSFDNLTITHSLLEKVRSDFGLRYMAFVLSSRRFKNRNALEHHFLDKRPITVAEKKIPLLFEWLVDDIDKRINTPAEETIKSNRELIEKWAVR